MRGVCVRHVVDGTISALNLQTTTQSQAVLFKEAVRKEMDGPGGLLGYCSLQKRYGKYGSNKYCLCILFMWYID